MTAAAAVWRAAERLGVDSSLSAAYWWARLAASGRTTRARAAGVEAEFAATTREEYLRASTFLGEEAVLRAFLADLDGDEVVWDVGANVGLYACFAARALSTGTVLGFEPEAINAERLRENLARNAPPERWRTSPVALWDRDASLALASEGRGVGSGHHYLSAAGDGPAVACRRGDSLVAEGHPAPDVLKIDVQGAELQVLDGLGDVLDGVRDAYAELHVEKTARYDASAKAVETRLAEAGFELTYFGAPDYDRGGVYHVRASRP